MIQINCSNRRIYTFIILGILAIISIGAWAYQPSGTANPVIMGHTFNELTPPSGCNQNEFLQWGGSTTGWKCAS